MERWGSVDLRWLSKWQSPYLCLYLSLYIALHLYFHSYLSLCFTFPLYFHLSSSSFTLKGVCGEMGECRSEMAV